MLEDKFKKIEISNDKLKSLSVLFLQGIENKSTKNSRRFAIENFLEFHKSRKAFEFQINDIHKYRRHLESFQEKSPTTVRNYLTSLRKFFDFLIEMNFIEKNPVKRVSYKIKDIEFIEKSYLSKNKINFIVNDKVDGRELKSRIILMLTIFTDFTLEEISNLKYEDLSFKDRSIYIKSHNVDNKINKLFKRHTSNINSGFLFLNDGNRNKNEKISERNVKELLIESLKTIGYAKKPLKTVKNTRILLDYKQHRSLKKLQEKYNIKLRKTALEYKRLFDEFNEDI